MPRPRKRENETWGQYRNRLIAHYIEEGYPEHQAVAIAYRMVEKIKKEKRKDKK